MEHGKHTWGLQCPVWVHQDRKGQWWAYLLPKGDERTEAKSGPWKTQEEAEESLLSFLNLIVAISGALPN